MLLKLLQKIQAATRFFLFAALTHFMWSGVGSTAANAQSLPLIRDAEIEAILRSYGSPLFRAAGLAPSAVRIFIVNDATLNAFVTRGSRMYMHTGLLMAAKSPSEVIGVMAHETGHIAGGHAVTFSTGVQQAMNTAVLTTLAGIAAGVATGNSDLGMAVALGGQGTAQRQLASFNRGQESSADAFALRALDRSEQSSQGLYNFFGRLSGQELLSVSRQDVYMRTHPLTRDRMSAVQAHLQTSRYTNVTPTPSQEESFARMQAKLFAFLRPQTQTLQRYPESDTSVPAKYARSIANFRRGRIDEALPDIDALIDSATDDPYFWELKGQMLLENGRPKEAVEAYNTADALLPNVPMIEMALAHAMIETEDKKYAARSQDLLRSVVEQEPGNSMAWEFLAKSYTDSGEEGLASYALAERAYLMGNFADARRAITRAEKSIIPNSVTSVRLQDLKSSIDAIAPQSQPQPQQKR